MIKRKPFIIAILVFGIVSVLAAFVLHGIIIDKTQAAKDKIYYFAEAQISELERTLSSYIQTTETLKLLVIDGNGKINDFNKVAMQLYNKDNAFRSIQLAPQGDVQYVYPIAGNEEAFGNLFEDPERKEEAEAARDTGKTTLAGPFELYQSGMGIVVRQPIYLEENGTESFWGFAIVVLNVPEIFESVNLNTFNNMGYEYQLWRIDPSNNKKQTIIKSEAMLQHDAINLSFKVFDNTWNLSVAPTTNWVENSDLMPVILSAVCVSLLVPLLIYTVLKINVQRDKMVDISNHDYLTSLYNGRKMNYVLNDLLMQQESFAFIYLDVNKFKKVNDTYGHLMGDKLLKEIANRIQNILTKDDYAFRVGGDEFTIIIKDTQMLDERLEKISNQLSHKVELDNFKYEPAVSIGYAVYPDDGHRLEEIVKCADKRMYQEKSIKIVNEKHSTGV